MTEQEFHILLVQEHKRLVAIAASFLRTSGMDGEAKDIAQEAAAKLWELSQKGYPIRDAKALAVRITKNLCVERWRAQRRLLTLRNDYALSLDEIALATGKPKGSVKATLSQARKQLLEEIKKMR